MAQLKPIIEQSMAQYAGAVLQSRALIDVRDGLKPSARQIFYSMLLHKLTNKNPSKKHHREYKSQPLIDQLN